MARNRRQPPLAVAAVASETRRYGATIARYGSATIAARAVGQPLSSASTPASRYSAPANHTVGRAPNTVAMEAMPPARSACTSCTAPKAWLAIPQQKNATSSSAVRASGAEPVSATA